MDGIKISLFDKMIVKVYQIVLVQPMDICSDRMCYHLYLNIFYTWKLFKEVWKETTCLSESNRKLST